MLPKHILVPTDLSEGAEQALDYACELARTLDAELHLLNVVAIPALGVPELGVALASSVLQQLARTRCTARLGQVLIRTGDARDMINRTAQELGIDLIVMGTHGRRGIT